MNDTFLLAMLIIFGIPFAIWKLLRTEYYAPLVVVQIIIGVVLGPGVLGSMYATTYKAIFSPQVMQALNGIAWWAVMLFVMLAGIELDLGEAWQHRKESLITASLALGAPLALGSIAAVGLLAFPGWIGLKATSWQFVLGIGMACAVTSLPILLLLMEKMAILRQPMGQRILRYASLDDLAIWGVLALILLDWNRLVHQVVFLFGFGLAALGVRRVITRTSEPDRLYVAIIWLAACGYFAEVAGLHFMVGAFLSGVVLDSKWFSRAGLDGLRRHVLWGFMPVYFLSTGLRTNWSLGGMAVLLAAAVLLFASVFGKLLGIRLASSILRWDRHDASIIGWLLQTKALIMIIFSSILLDRQIITSEMFTSLLLMAIGSTMLTIPLVQPRLDRARGIALTTG